jgi:hypothetical protein
LRVDGTLRRDHCLELWRERDNALGLVDHADPRTGPLRAAPDSAPQAVSDVGRDLVAGLHVVDRRERRSERSQPRIMTDLRLLGRVRPQPEAAQQG